MVSHVAAGQPALVLDVATGPAGVARRLAADTPAAIVGVDVSAEMLGRGVANVADAGLTQRILFTLGRAEQLPFPDASFDGLTFTYVLRYVADPAAVLREIARVVRPGGVIASLDFGVPPRQPFRALWWLYTRAVLPVAGLLTGGRAWFEVGRFLGPSITTHEARFPPDWTVAAWTAAGITDVGRRPMSTGGGVVMWGRRA